MNKLILFDVDDTIIDHSVAKSSIPKETLVAIGKLQSKGYEVGLASGRSEVHIQHVMELLKMESAVSFGGHMVTCKGEVIFKKVLDWEEVSKLLKDLYRTLYPAICVDDEYIYVKDFMNRVRKFMYKQENTLEGESLVTDINTN